ncbi:phosphate regulon sensor histidine kinase PhoR [Marinicella sp. W31]|uniref:phosphate regulon sensor histidine kinase PhoR n=1 Tax=Marinicella sp. W31 TaxID=3023713 RepID=UPI003758100A
MDSYWKKEWLALTMFILLSVITGLLSGYWALSFFMWLLLYMLWKLHEFRQFYNWYMSGASKKEVPLNYGVWEQLTCRVLHNKKIVKHTQKKNHYLLQQFNTTARALPFATLLLNEDNEIQWTNLIAEKILGVESQDIGTKVDNIIRDPKFINMLVQDEKDQQIKMVHPLDQDKKVHLRLIRMNKDRFLLIGRDISEQESLQRSRKAFIDNASHELRTPLTVVSGYLEMMQSSEGFHSEWSDAINQAQEQTNRMNTIINDMLKLSSIEHDKFIESSDEDLQMPHLLNSLYNDIKNSTDARHHNFEVQIDSSLSLLGDRSEITSICLNLLHNAVIHTAPQTKITIQWFFEDGKAHLHVCDDGDGIDAEHIPHLTERFYRVDNSRSKNLQSTGLGLAIVKHICIKHSAEFEIESKKGVGSCFKVIFPASRVIT